MKSAAHNEVARALRGLQFKIVVPIIVVMGVLGIVLYVFALRSISDFSRVRIQEDLERNSRAVYSICDTALQSLLTAGLGSDPVATRIKQGRVLGEVEDYLKQHNLQGVLYSEDGRKILFSSEPDPDTRDILSRATAENVVLELPLRDKTYYTRHFQFELWDWHIVLIKDGAYYADAIVSVQSAYVTTGLVIGIAGLLLFYYLKRFIQRPIRSIVTSIERGDLPAYKGVEELEFLSNTIRDRTQALRAAKETAERASMAKTRFLASASHDLRQPMHTVSLLVGVLKEQRLAPEQQELVNKIQRAVNATQALFDALLEISKLDAGAVKANVCEFPIGDLLRLIETHYGPQAEARRLTLRVVYSSALVLSDPALLGSVLNNFVSNAIRYTDRGKIVVGCRRRGDKLIAQVIDTGVGVPKAHLGDIFEEFVQLPSGGERKTGLGLGLSIARRSAELLHHPIRVQSVEGRGSVFSVEIPRITRRLPVAGPTLPAAVPGVDLVGTFIVVIEDNPENILATERLCRQWGCKVVTGRSAQEAAEKLEAHLRAPDLIISDYQLGDGHDGFSAVQQLRALVGEDIPAIIVTGDVSLASIENNLPLPRMSLIFKPVNLDKLRQRIEHYVSNN